ncbi:MAG: permease [Pseudomonadota bacterium]
MNILIGTIVLALMAGWFWQKLETDERRAEAYSGVRRMLINNAPRLLVALVSAGLFAELLPEEVVRQYLGDTSGFKGVALGMMLGILTPGGAFVSFALAAGATQAGATAPAMMSYLTAWALFAITKVMAEELALLGARFIVTRFAVSIPLPLLVGGIALALPI